MRVRVGFTKETLTGRIATVRNSLEFAANTKLSATAFVLAYLNVSGGGKTDVDSQM